MRNRTKNQNDSLLARLLLIGKRIFGISIIDKGWQTVLAFCHGHISSIVYQNHFAFNSPYARSHKSRFNGKVKSSNWEQHLWVSIYTIALLLILVLPVHLLAESLFIFNPESNSRHGRAAKADLEAYLASQGLETEVYIFANAKDFEKSIPRWKPQYAIVASYYYESMRKKYSWQSALAGNRHGHAGFNKILVSQASISNPKQLNNQGIAAVSFGSSSIEYIENNFLIPVGLTKETVRLVTVSKDVDGIMALGFGQVQAAIVTQDSYLLLQKINPTAVESLVILKKFDTVAYPKFVVMPGAKNSKKYILAMNKISIKDSGKDSGQHGLRFLNITEFRK